jgi:ketosteroid isomerase-like protein
MTDLTDQTATDATDTPDTDDTGGTPGTRETLRGYLDALLTGDLDRIRAYFAPTATWHIHGTLPFAGTHRGADAIMEFLSTAVSGRFVPGTQQFRFADILVDGEAAILEWNVTGTATATGLAYDNEYCGIFIIRDGRIHAVREYLDTEHVRQVLFG